MKNKLSPDWSKLTLQQKICAIFQRTYQRILHIFSTLCVSLKRTDSTTEKDLCEKEKCGKFEKILRKITVMIVQSSDSSHKDSNQNVMYLALGLIGLTVANTQFNDKADKQIMFYLSLTLIIICFLCLWFIQRQSKRHEEYHKRKQRFLLKKISENDFNETVIKPEIKKILKTEYLDKLDENANIDIITSEIFKNHSEILKDTIKKYQRKYVFELLKLKTKTLTEKFDWEFFGTPVAIFEFIVVDLGRYVGLILWFLLFIKANYNIISCN